MPPVPRWRLTRRDLLAASLATGGARAARRPRAVTAKTPSATTPAAAGVGARFADLDALVEQRMAQLQIPGVAVGIITGDREHAAAFGITNIDHPLPVNTATLFQIGSISKAFTGLALMRFVERGDLDLETPVRAVLPNFRVADPVVSEETRMRHLVTHTGGWLDPADLVETGDGDDALARYVAGMADWPQIAPLGRYFSYSNSGFSTAGRVIEVIAGQSFETAMRDFVLDPLGMEHAAYFAEQIMTDSFTVGHHPPPGDPAGPPVVAKPWALPRSANPAGGLTASLDDMLRFARFQLGNGMAGSRSLLGVETLRRTRSPLGPGGTVPGEGEIVIDNIGVAWMIWQRDGARIVSHSGGTNGQMSTFIFVPERDFAMSLLTNALSGILLAFELTDWALERLLGLRRSPLEVISATKAPISEYAGGYALPDGSLAIQVGETSGGFQITWETPDRPAGTSPLQVVGVDLVTMRYMGADLLADFVRDGDGEIAWIRFLGRLVPRAA